MYFPVACLPSILQAIQVFEIVGHPAGTLESDSDSDPLF